MIWGRQELTTCGKVIRHMPRSPDKSVNPAMVCGDRYNYDGKKRLLSAGSGAAGVPSRQRAHTNVFSVLVLEYLVQNGCGAFCYMCRRFTDRWRENLVFFRKAIFDHDLVTELSFDEGPGAPLVTCADPIAFPTILKADRLLRPQIQDNKQPSLPQAQAVALKVASS